MTIRLDDSFEQCKKPCPQCGNDSVYKYVKKGPHIEARCAFCDCHIQFCSLTKNLRAKWVKEVKERDGYICQRCGRHLVGYEAQAHHMLPEWFMPERKFDTSNGICLCRECHKQIHGKGGTIKQEETNAETE